ncbi:hypothetical protein RI129_012491 [Pyrocoelia pectoralis]|uniref:Uncharacterized protein n=1 Tax=Pyrocoelia pectoralis TaxID=417401 RepID=A0AAN7ZEY7_9COLE
MKVTLYALLVFAIGAYCNCGCLNCNKQFHVVSPPGSRVQIIHRKTHHHCICPTVIPCSVQIPVDPRVETPWTRTYGYQVSTSSEKFCPIPQEYDAHLEIPKAPRRPTYLRNIFAHTDRVVIEEPPRVCSPPIFKTLGGRMVRPEFERYNSVYNCPWCTQQDCKCKNPDSINFYNQIVWAPQLVVQNFLSPQQKVDETRQSTMSGNETKAEHRRDDASHTPIASTMSKSSQVEEESKSEELTPEMSEQNQKVKADEQPGSKMENEVDNVIGETFNISKSEKLVLLKEGSAPKMYLKRTTAKITSSPKEHNRRKRSINYKMLGLDTKTSYLPSKRHINFRKFSFQKNRGGTHSQYAMAPWENRRLSLRNVLAHRRHMLGQQPYYMPEYSRYRHKRSVRVEDESSLPFYSWSGESNEIEEEDDIKPIKRRRLSDEESIPLLLQTMPFLKMLSFPLKFVSDLHRNPFLAVVPKVMRVSNALFMEFVKSFMGDYRKVKRKRALHKRLHKREIHDCDSVSSRLKRETSNRFQGNQLTYNQENLLLVDFLKTLARNMRKSNDYIEIGRKKRSVDTKHEYKDFDSLSWEDLMKELKAVLRLEKETGHHVYEHNFDEGKSTRTKRSTEAEDMVLLKEFKSALDEPDSFLSAVKSTSNRFPRNRDEDGRRTLLEPNSKTKREASLLQAVLKLLKAERLVPKSKPKRSTDSLETRTINEKIAQTANALQKLIASNFSEDFDIYKKLLKLQTFKVEIVKLWQSNKGKMVEKIDDTLKLKEEILREITRKIGENLDDDMGKWIKTLVHLQKFHCVLKTLRKEPKNELMEVLGKINFVTINNDKQLLNFLKQRQRFQIQRDVELLSNLKILVASGEMDKIKKEAEFLWESKNLKKLQRDSVTEMVDKLMKKLRIRRELKILFDLQKQLELCDEKQLLLMTDVDGPK